MARNSVVAIPRDRGHVSVCAYRGFNNFGDKRLFEVEQTAVIEKGP